MPYRLRPDDVIIGCRAGRPGWVRQQLPAEAGHCITDRMQLEQGVGVAFTAYHSPHELIEESLVDQQNALLTITIGLEGRSSYSSNAGCAFDFRAGHTTATVFRSISGERRYKANEAVRQLRLSIDEAALRRYGLQSMLAQTGDTPARQLHFAKTAAATGQLVKSLLRYHADSPNPLLDMKIAALSLLAEQSRHMLPQASDCKLRAADEERLQMARALMLEQFDRPLTVAYLCAAVGLNEFKLKQGFRLLFGNSPYRMLTEIRMQHALQLLESGLQVAQVAYRCGYEHPANFSAAFSRFYGHAPKTVRGKQG